ncbi:unnamed protein product, partial [Prorocentrum cordatum]
GCARTTGEAARRPDGRRRTCTGAGARAMAARGAPAGGAPPREFVDVLWDIGERRCCDEVTVRYDCGHAFHAEVWAKTLPKTREYGAWEAERRRFMEHSIFALTKDPSALMVQITVHEGRCRHCGRGQRHMLTLGRHQMDLAKERTARRLELPLSSHTFLSAVGQVCQLPDSITLPAQASTIKLSDGDKLSDGPQWTRREVEDELRAVLRKYVCAATVVLLCAIAQLTYLLLLRLRPLSGAGALEPELAGGGASAEGPGAAGAASAWGLAARNWTLGSLEAGLANSTWALSAMTASVHQAFGLAGDGAEGAPLLWSVLVRPVWLVVSVLLAPVLWAMEVVIAIPRFVVVDICSTVLRQLVARPLGWLCGMLVRVLHGAVVFIIQCVFAQPTAVIAHIPMTNPIDDRRALAAGGGAVGPAAAEPVLPQRLRRPARARAGARAPRLRGRVQAPGAPRAPAALRVEVGAQGSKAGLKGIPTSRGQKDAGRGADRKPDAPGRPDRPQVVKQDSKAPLGGAAAEKMSAPACFVCLDRPSRYVLEPCGHRVVCSECAVQLVEAAARNRSLEQASGGGGHHSERGGACPNCGTAVARAVRLFS